MEAIIKQTNIAINIATMKANIQSALKATRQTISQVAKQRCKALTLPRLYRQQLRVVYGISGWMERHTKLTNLCLAALYVALICRALMCL